MSSSKKRASGFRLPPLAGGKVVHDEHVVPPFPQRVGEVRGDENLRRR